MRQKASLSSNQSAAANLKQQLKGSAEPSNGERPYHYPALWFRSASFRRHLTSRLSHPCSFQLFLSKSLYQPLMPMGNYTYKLFNFRSVRSSKVIDSSQWWRGASSWAEEVLWTDRWVTVCTVLCSVLCGSYRVVLTIVPTGTVVTVDHSFLYPDDSF